MKHAELYTFDGVVFSNSQPFPFEKLASKFRVDPHEYIPPSIVPLSRDDTPDLLMSPQELFKFIGRSISSVEPDMWQYLWNREADVYGNTGRPDNLLWRKLTEHTLRQGNILPVFKDIFYRPKHRSGIASKGEAILRLLYSYDTVTHYDNNPWVVFGLAYLIPKAHFVLVSDEKAGTLMQYNERRIFPNVQRVFQLVYTEQIPEHGGLAKKRRHRRFRSYFEGERIKW